MSATFQSSGDLIADRRFEWARESAAQGDHAAAADLLAQVLELAPDYGAAWFALGEARAQLGERDDATAAYERAKALDPQDQFGATLHLARLNADAADMPAAYVRALFDGYAARFDDALTRGLAYRAPEVLRAAVERVAPGRRFARAIDLGCGTGLGGEAFTDVCGEMIGIDLSPAMLAQARAKTVYTRLIAGDVVAVMANEPDASADLILAADVFMYLRDLAPVLAQCRRVLAVGGVLAFTVETHSGDETMLKDTLRFGHTRDGVAGTLAETGFVVTHLADVSTRTEKGEPVPGLAVVARG